MAKKKPEDYGARDAGAIMQTGKTNHNSDKANPGYNKPQKIKGPGGGGAGWKPVKQDKPQKGSSYGTGTAKTGY
jgi:hypothetical protein